jgi:anti-sigma factor RsiW
MHLSAERMAALVERRLPDEERRAAVAHLVDCDECRREYAEVGRLMEAPRTTWRRFGAGAAIAAAAVIAFVLIPRPSSDATREERATERVALPEIVSPIAVVAPAEGERLLGRPITFGRRADRADAMNRGTVQSSEGKVLWRANTNDTTIAAPEDLKLEEGAVYYWFVDALRADGRAARSVANSFRR